MGFHSLRMCACALNDTAPDAVGPAQRCGLKGLSPCPKMTNMVLWVAHQHFHSNFMPWVICSRMLESEISTLARPQKRCCYFLYRA